MKRKCRLEYIRTASFVAYKGRWFLVEQIWTDSVSLLKHSVGEVRILLEKKRQSERGVVFIDFTCDVSDRLHSRNICYCNSYEIRITEEKKNTMLCFTLISSFTSTISFSWWFAYYLVVRRVVWDKDEKRKGYRNIDTFCGFMLIIFVV